MVQKLEGGEVVEQMVAINLVVSVVNKVVREFVRGHGVPEEAQVPQVGSLCFQVLCEFPQVGKLDGS